MYDFGPKFNPTQPISFQDIVAAKQTPLSAIAQSVPPILQALQRRREQALQQQRIANFAQTVSQMMRQQMPENLQASSPGAGALSDAMASGMLSGSSFSELFDPRAIQSKNEDLEYKKAKTEESKWKSRLMSKPGAYLDATGEVRVDPNLAPGTHVLPKPDSDPIDSQLAKVIADSYAQASNMLMIGGPQLQAMAEKKIKFAKDMTALRESISGNKSASESSPVSSATSAIKKGESGVINGVKFTRDNRGILTTVIKGKRVVIDENK